MRVVPPGGPYFLMPWQKVHKVSIATQSVDIVWDPTKDQATIECVTKDNLTTGVNGQLRYRISENNLYAYLFGVRSPLEHIMGFFVSVLRERIANFVDPKGQGLVAEAEVEGDAEAGSGVSCASCHMPRISHDISEWSSRIIVDHNQSANLSPATKRLAGSMTALTQIMSTFGDKVPLIGDFIAMYGAKRF